MKTLETTFRNIIVASLIVLEIYLVVMQTI